MQLLGAMKLLTTVKSIKYKTMLSYCLKCKKKILRAYIQPMVKQCYQNVPDAAVKNQNLLKSNKQKDY